MEIIKGKIVFKIAYDQIFSPLYVNDLKKIVRIFLKKKLKELLMLEVRSIIKIESFKIDFSSSRKKNYSLKLKFHEISLMNFQL